MLLEKIGTAAMLEMTAEECIELAHVCLKAARIIRGDNPTDDNMSLVMDHMHEEIADVQICIDELRPVHEEVEKWKERKIERMKERLSGENE